MRRRITKALVTTVAAGASIATLGLSAAGSAGAAVAHPAKVHQQGSLPLISTTNTGGFEASGRDFRYVTALIRVPDMAENGLYPQTYVELSNGSAVGGGDTSGDTDVKAGIETCLVAEAQNPNFTCDPGVEWVGFVEAFNNSVNSPFFTHFVPLNVVQGDGVGFSIYFDQAGNELHFVLTPPTAESCSTGPANECYFKTQAYGPLYDHASGLVDYTNNTGQPIPLPIFGERFRVTQFLQGALTTYSGDRGSWTGPWTTSEVEATSNGLPYPQGSVRLSPGPLWSDGVSVNGAVRGDDAFGVWRRVG